MRKSFLILAVLVALIGFGYYLWDANWNSPPTSQTVAWIPSTELKSTQIMPSIGTPLKPGRSAIWCATFQMAWDQLCDQVNGAAITFHEPNEAVERLNRSRFDSTQLPKDSYYVNAGRISDGIDDSIRRDMANRFPGHRVTPFETNDLTVAIAYAYLEANLKFTIPFAADKMTFRDSQGNQSQVQAFGIADKHRFPGRWPGEQVAVLFQTPNEFAIDLDKFSSPHRIILAQIEPQATLAGCWTAVHESIKNQKNGPQALNPKDEVMVPKMNWGINHRVAEIEGKPINTGRLNGSWIAMAFQSIRFGLDEHGAQLASEAMIAAEKSAKRFLHFGRPFLIAMLRRDATEPYFLMWVDNAELMKK